MSDSTPGDGEISAESERLTAQAMISDCIGRPDDPPGTRGWVLNKLDRLKDVASDLTTDVRTIRFLILELESCRADKILGWDIGFDQLIYQKTMLPREIIPLVKSQGSTITIGGLIRAARQIREAKQQVLDFNPTASEDELTRGVARIVGAEDVTQEAIGKVFGVSQQAVSKAMDTTETLKFKEKVVTPEWMTNSRDCADFQKLSTEAQIKVTSREIKLNRACVLEGIRQEPVVEPPLEKVKKGFSKLSEEDRIAFDKWRAGL